ncbi:MAG: matrixin family metalloprotease [Nitrosopumilus sp.]|nr:matrixin family metalloprotease [Nitrosopumilus sp.]
MVASDDHQIIYYSFEDVPDIPNEQIPVDALKKAIDTWETLNPNLEFIQSENSNIEIKWQKYSSVNHTGLATCNSVLFGILTHCVLEISVGAEDCNSNFVQNDENMVTNILMHEIGHALRLGHSSEKNHLMYSTESPQITFDTKGYVLPERFEELYVGQKLMLFDKQELESNIELLDIKITREQSQYDEYFKQYQYYEGKTLSPEEYKKAQNVFLKLNSQGEKINSMIDQQNQLIEQINEILNQLGCNPNFEITS